MPRDTCDATLDLDNRDIKRRLMTWIGGLAGHWSIKIKPKKVTRSQAQSNYYFACVVTPLARFLDAQQFDYGEVGNSAKDAAHEMLKAKFLSRAVYNKRGDRVGFRVRSHKDLSVTEMVEYTEKCRVYLADEFHIETPNPDRNFAPSEKLKGAP